MSNLKDWLARDVLIVGKLEAADEIYVPGCGYYQPDPGAYVIICESAEPLHEIQGEEMTFSVDESLASENAKLRELVADMWRGMCNNYSRNCFVCRHYPRTASPNCECEFRTRMAQLGIEVDE